MTKYRVILKIGFWKLTLAYNLDHYDLGRLLDTLSNTAKMYCEVKIE